MSFASLATSRSLSNTAAQLLNKCSRVAQCLLPQRCLLCTAAAQTRILCDACYASLPWLGPTRCEQCALPLHKSGSCGACIAKPPRYDRVVAVFRYAWPLVPLIQRYKYGGDLALAGLYAKALANEPLPAADLIIPMPLSRERLRSRGFNQALEIARHVSHATGIALSASACRRIRDSAPQAQLPWAERAKNIRGAFVCDVDLSAKRVAVVDDVLTTGATLNELTRSLRKAGAAEVQGWVIARTVKRD